jgi:S1-C subfamily serine protease
MKGCSGSPIFNLDGEVIAVLYGGQDSSMEKYPIPLEVHGSIKFWKEDISLATSSQQASELVEKFLADEAVK